MAYRDTGKAQNSSDGVPVKIAEKYQPPSKITLPVEYQTGNPSDILFMEYDFSLENAVIQNADLQRHTLKQMGDAATEKVANVIEEFSRMPSSLSPSQPNDTDPNEPTGVTGSDIQTENTESPDFEEQVKSQAQVAHHSQTNDNQTVQQIDSNTSSQSLPFFADIGQQMLTPMPIGQSRVHDSQRVGSQNSPFDLKDFEREQDPFENLELKTLNDMEELNKVLMGSQIPDQSRVQTQGNHTEKSFQAPVSNFNQAPDSNSIHLTSSGVSYQARPQSHRDVSNPYNAGQSVKHVEYPDPDTLGLDKDSSSISLSNNHVMYRSNSPADNRLASALLSRTTNTPPSNTDNMHATGNFHGFNNRTFLPPIPTSKYLVQQQSPQPNFSHTGQTAHNGVTNYFDPQHYKNGMDYNGVVRSNNWMSPGQTPIASQMRNAKSTPDISALGQCGRSSPIVTAHATSKTPPPYPRPSSPQETPSAGQEWLQSLLTSHQSDTNSTNTPTFTSNHSQHWNPYSVLPKPSSPSQPVTPPDRSTKKISKPPINSLPDPYHKLSREAQRFTDNIADMGFNRARVARTVDKLGQDDKKVVDHLCLVNRLKDKGQNADEAEKALYLFKNVEDKALQYLQISGQFQELGFEKAKIEKALVKFDLDEDKSLDYLTGT